MKKSQKVEDMIFRNAAHDVLRPRDFQMMVYEDDWHSFLGFLVDVAHAHPQNLFTAQFDTSGDAEVYLEISIRRKAGLLSDD